MERAIDGGTLRDNLTDIYGDGNRLVYLNDVLDLIDEQPTLTPPNEPLCQENKIIIVKCKGCKYHKPIDYCEKHNDSGWYDDDFCSFGKKKE